MSARQGAIRLQVEQLVAGWSTTPVIGPVSLHLAAGEVLGLAGPNGAGKSTLLAAITGAARILGGRVSSPPGVRLALQSQHVPEMTGVPLSGRELLALTGAATDSLPPWLATHLDVRLDRLSGGQRQFLHLWACLAAPAEVVLLDEPTNNLDPDGVSFLTGALRRIAGNGTGLLVVSHDSEFLAATCDRIFTVTANGMESLRDVHANHHDESLPRPGG